VSPKLKRLSGNSVVRILEEFGCRVADYEEKERIYLCQCHSAAGLSVNGLAASFYELPVPSDKIASSRN